MLVINDFFGCARCAFTVEDNELLLISFRLLIAYCENRKVYSNVFTSFSHELNKCSCLSISCINTL